MDCILTTSKYKELWWRKKRGKATTTTMIGEEENMPDRLLSNVFLVLIRRIFRKWSRSRTNIF